MGINECTVAKKYNKFNCFLRYVERFTIVSLETHGDSNTSNAQVCSWRKQHYLRDDHKTVKC